MAELTVKDLNAAERGSVGNLRKQVTALAEKLGVVRQTVADIAPKVMRLYNGLVTKYEDRLGGFVGFARLIDPSVPTHARDKDGEVGYLNHKTYYTLTYIRRTYQTANRPRGQQGRRDPATDQLARTVATLLQVVKDEAVIWSALEQEFRFNKRMIARVRSRVEQVEPIIKLQGIKPVAGLVVHMEPTAKAPAQAEKKAA